MSLKIVCADESPILIAGMERLLSPLTDQAIVGVTNQSQLEDVLRAPFDLLVTEIRIGDLDVLEFLGSRDTNSEWMKKVILFTYHDNPTYPARAHAAGALDFVLKRQPVSELFRAVRAMTNGVFRDHTLLTRARDFLMRNHHVPSISPNVLTKRELQILIHLSLGLSNREVSHSLGISLETVKEHVQNVLRKLKVNDRTAAAVWAMRNGVPTLDISSKAIGETASYVNHVVSMSH